MRNNLVFKVSEDTYTIHGTQLIQLQSDKFYREDQEKVTGFISGRIIKLLLEGKIKKSPVSIHDIAIQLYGYSDYFKVRCIDVHINAVKHYLKDLCKVQVTGRLKARTIELKEIKE